MGRATTRSPRRIFARSKGRTARAHPLIVHLAADARLDDWAVEHPRGGASRWSAVGVAGAADAHPAARTAGRGGDHRRRRHRRAARASASRSRAGAACVSVRWWHRGAEREPVRCGQPDDRRSRGRGSRGRRRLRARRRPACEVGVESTIVKLHRRAARGAARPGGLPREAIEPIHSGRSRSARCRRAPAAPGTRSHLSHYAPRAEVIAVRSPAEVAAGAGSPSDRAARIAMLAPGGPRRRSRQWGGYSRRSTTSLPDDLAGDQARALYAALARSPMPRWRRCGDRRVASRGRAGRKLSRDRLAPHGGILEEHAMTGAREQQEAKPDGADDRTRRHHHGVAELMGDHEARRRGARRARRRALREEDRVGRIARRICCSSTRGPPPSVGCA